MSATIMSPKDFSPADLDDYLARGWRPYGQQIYTADYIQLQLGEVYSVLPTRLALDKHKWRKSQRKLLRKNKGIFDYIVRPARLTAEKIEINRLYRNLFPSKSVENLTIHLEHDGRQIFNTQEVCIYHQNKLVAFSFFDLGERCVYSKVGLYNPSYTQYSLGIFSMYLEVEWSIDQGLSHYYPGYISPETPLFDYKKMLGLLEYWSLQTKKWLPLNDFKLGEAPLKMVGQKTKKLYEAFIKTGLKAKVYDYCFFEMPLIYPNSNHYLDSPKIIVLHTPNEKEYWIARYKIEHDSYEYWETISHYKVNFTQPANRSTPIFPMVLQLQRPIIQSDDLGSFTAALKKNIGAKVQKFFIPN